MAKQKKKTAKKQKMKKEESQLQQAVSWLANALAPEQKKEN